MHCIIVLYFVIIAISSAKNAFCLHLSAADINQILDYLQSQGNDYHDKYDKYNKNDLAKSEIATDLQSILSGGQSGAYQTSQYNQEDGNKTPHELSKDSEDSDSNIDGLMKYISQNTKAPYRFNKKDLIPKNSDIVNKLSEYSKVYLVLNPQAKMNSADLKGISDILSRLISKKKQRSHEQRFYKGFAIMDDILSRRRSRDSKEKFPKDSIERDYKPKRARSDYSVGGGRTAIPYIRHRGDIYERE